MVKGLARFGNCLRHGLLAKSVDVSPFEKGGYSPMTAGILHEFPIIKQLCNYTSLDVAIYFRRQGIKPTRPLSLVCMYMNHRDVCRR